MRWSLKRREAETRAGQRDSGSAPDALSEATITAGYRWILGRDPAPAEVAAALHYYTSAGGDLHTFQNGLLSSEEFRNRRIFVQQHMRIAPVDLFGDKLVFLHIEKCGGTTMRTMLEAQFAAHRICPERFNGLADWTANELAAYDLFAGHFDLACCSVIPGRRNAIITMIREPKARLLSLYYFWKSHAPAPAFGDHTLVGLARERTAVAFFSHPAVVRHPSIRDTMAGQLTRMMGSKEIVDGFPILSDEDTILADPERSLQDAWGALCGLAAFGILERFEESRRLLNDRLGLQMQPIAPQQVLATLVSPMLDAVRPKREPVSAELAALLDALTPIDQALYARATALFAEQVSLLRSSV
jgi:alpha-D-ribose 1-methylphosphonate 5-triphosphate synthase subunit PhnG